MADSAAVNPVEAILPSAVSTGGNIVSTLIQNKANYDLWKEQTAYNAPKEQMKRLREAGLNPALMYGSGVNAASTGNMGSPPQMSKPDISNSAVADLLKFQTVKNLERQNETIEYQNDILKAKSVEAYNAAFLSDRERELIMDVDAAIPAWLRDKKGMGGPLAAIGGMTIGGLAVAAKLLQLQLTQQRIDKIPDLGGLR